MVTLGLKMRKRSLTLWMVCFLLRAALSAAFVCTGVDDSLILNICQRVSHRSVIVHLYSSGNVGECACTLSSTRPLDSVEITSIPKSQLGMFKLVKDGNTVQTPETVSIKSQLDLVLRKNSPEIIDQCLYVTGAVNTTLHVTCKTIRDLTSEQPSNTESLVVTEPENNTSLTESLVVTEPENNTSLTESPVVTGPENDTSLTESPVVTGPENDTSLTESPVVTGPENDTSLTESPVVTEPENNKSLTESPVVTGPENNTSLTESPVVTEPENNTSLTEIPVVTEPENNTSLTESPVVTEPENNKSLIESLVVTEPENTKSLIESPVVKEPENNKSLTGIIVGAMIGGIAGIVIVVAMVLMLRRKHKRKEGQTGNTDPVPDYYNVPGGSVDQLHGTASNSSIQSDYVNTPVDIDTVASNAANMNTYESLALQDLAETDHNYGSIARTEAGIYINTAISGAS